ncbi:MAG: sensor histidine kinase [Bacteriovorax sp.]|nr:sensor histidine kinase [Bacteriovorax sp.]
MRAIQIILLFLSLHLTLNSHAFASINIATGSLEQDISEDFFLTAGSTLPNKNKTLRYGYFSGTKQAHISLKNDSSLALEKYLYFDTLTGKIDLFEQVDSKLSPRFLETSGSSTPFGKRKFKGILAAFKIELPAHSEKTFLFNITSRHNFNSKVFVGNMETLNGHQSAKISFLDFYIGGILCLIFYNLFIYLFLRDKNYLFYCLFSLSFMLVILDIHGLLDKLFMPSTFSFSHYLICFSSMALFFATLFTYNFLEIANSLSKYVIFFKALMLISLIIAIFGVTSLGDTASVLLGNLIDILLVTANAFFIFCSFELRKISSTAKFYLFSWLIVGFSLLAWFGMTFGIISNNFFTQHSLLYANLGQMLVLALALAYKIHVITEEKLVAEAKALQKDKYQRLVRVLIHDIANSLTIINSLSKRLLKLNQLEGNNHLFFEKISFAADNITNILNSVREEELLTERKKEIDLSPINIYESLLSSSIVFEDQLKNKNIKLLIKVPNDIYIKANKTCFLNNIVNNILSNAIKFSSENSTIEISSELVADQVAITFRDYGEGISPILIHDIFYSNKLISSLGTNSELGNGLGTTLMREYIELFGGKLVVESIQKNPDNLASGTSIITIFPVIYLSN